MLLRPSEDATEVKEKGHDDTFYALRKGQISGLTPITNFPFSDDKA
jgi:hypothetical protein